MDKKMNSARFVLSYLLKKLSRNENERLIRPPRDPDFPP